MRLARCSRDTCGPAGTGNGASLRERRPRLELEGDGIANRHRLGPPRSASAGGAGGSPVRFRRADRAEGTSSTTKETSNALMAVARHATIDGPNLMGAGALPVRTHRHQVALLTGISRKTCFSRRSDNSGGEEAGESPIMSGAGAGSSAAADASGAAGFGAGVGRVFTSEASDAVGCRMAPTVSREGGQIQDNERCPRGPEFVVQTYSGRFPGRRLLSGGMALVNLEDGVNGPPACSVGLYLRSLKRRLRGSGRGVLLPLIRKHDRPLAPLALKRLAVGITHFLWIEEAPFEQSIHKQPDRPLTNVLITVHPTVARKGSHEGVNEGRLTRFQQLVGAPMLRLETTLKVADERRDEDQESAPERLFCILSHERGLAYRLCPPVAVKGDLFQRMVREALRLR